MGKTAFAVALARRLACEGEKTASCTCRNCRRIAHNNHPGLKVLSVPPEKQVFPVDMVRDEVVAALALKPMETGWRVFIFNEAEKMSPEAANVLLKTLEEPPPESLLILECTGADAVIETLVSRCHRIRFSPLAAGEISSYLERERNVVGNAAKALARLSCGALGRALEILDAGMLDAGNDFLDMLLASNADNIHESADNLVKSVSAKTLIERRKKAYPMLDMLQSYFRDVMVRQVSSGIDVFHADRTEFAPNGPLPSLRAERMISAVEDARKLIEENTNIKFVILSLVKEYLKAKRVS